MGRVALEQQKQKVIKTVPVITGNGFGTNSAFIGMGDGQGTSVKSVRTQQLLLPSRFDPSHKVCASVTRAEIVIMSPAVNT